MILVLMELPPRFYTSVLNKKSAGLLGYFIFPIGISGFFNIPYLTFRNPLER